MAGDDTLRDSKRTIIGLGVGPATGAGMGPRAAADPAATDPAITDPAVTDPAVTDPAVTVPVPGAPDAASHDGLIGQLVIGRYVVEERLGSGAFGAVYRGHHDKLRRPVAIKVLHAHLVHEPQILRRFRREAELAARLAHGNVAGVLDVGETPDGRQLIVLDLAIGRPLTALLGEPMPRERVIGLVRQLLLGLEHAHAAGLVHRDLKPDNIIVEQRADGAEIPRIVDFGIAVLGVGHGGSGESRLTATGQMIGTPLYMAPEQARLDAIDHRVDQFALGVIVYQMLSGTTPFKGSPVDVAIANMTKDPPSIADRAAVDADPLLERFARKLMARDPGQRFPDVQAALAALELVDRDPAAAGSSFDGADLRRAMAVVTLPPPPPKAK